MRPPSSGLSPTPACYIHRRINGAKRLSDLVIGLVLRPLQVDKGLGNSRQSETSSLFGVRICGGLNRDVSHLLQNGRGRLFHPLMVE
jgi:hypothetical protein